jgi:hypothetical protein
VNVYVALTSGLTWHANDGFIYRGNDIRLMTDLDPIEPDLARRQDLARMKRLATGLLLVVTCIYILTRLFHGLAPWLGYLEATMEAAMVGAIADWFAVTALFRHPLGLKIPRIQPLFPSVRIRSQPNLVSLYNRIFCPSR